LRDLEDLLTMEQKLAAAPGRMVRPRPLQIFGDVDVLQPVLILEDEGEAIGERGTAFAQRFHLGAGEYESGLPRVFDVIVVARLAVPRNDFLACVLRHDRPPLCSRSPVRAFAGTAINSSPSAASRTPVPS